MRAVNRTAPDTQCGSAALKFENLMDFFSDAARPGTTIFANP